MDAAPRGAAGPVDVAPALAAAAYPGLGAVAALGQPPWGLWPVALAAYALLLHALARSRRPVLAAWAAGAGHFAVALHWIAEPFLIDAAVTGWLAPVALVATCGGLALFWGAGAGLGARWLGGPVGSAAGLAMAELARSYVLTGFPWALSGHVLIDTAALPSASILGAHGLGIAVLVGAGAVATLRAPAVVAGLVLWAAPFGLARLVPPAGEAAAGAPVVRLVQPNAPQHLKWDPDHAARFFERGLALTAEPGAFDAVVWPETALPTLLDASETLRPTIARAAGGAPVVIGAQRYGPAGRPRNALALLDGEAGAVVHVYDKHRLVPFGEFLPWPDLFGALGFGPLAAQLAGIFAPGPGPETFALPGVGRALPLICYEAIFPQDLRRASPRADAVLHLTNDAWFGAGAGPRQHLALARLRAAESGLPVLRAANTGISASIDARGRVLASLELDTAGRLDVALPPAAGRTPYGAIGDLGPLAVLTLLASVVFVRGRAARH